MRFPKRNVFFLLYQFFHCKKKKATVAESLFLATFVATLKNAISYGCVTATC